MKWTVKTDIGVVRSQNQDNAAVFEKDGIVFAIICDGMGGHKGGAHASGITIDVYRREFQKSFPKNKDSDSVLKWFYNCLKQTKREMTAYAQTEDGLMDMGTTVSCAVIFEKEIFIYNVGDSRVYAFTGMLQQITRDHNIRNYYIKEYGYTDEQAATVMGAAALTSALGPDKRTTVEQFIVNRTPGIKKLVLTTDGIHDYIAKPKFETILGSRKSDDAQKIEDLIKFAIKGKSSDNMTAIIVDLSEDK